MGHLSGICLTVQVSTEREKTTRLKGLTTDLKEKLKDRQVPLLPIPHGYPGCPCYIAGASKWFSLCMHGAQLELDQSLSREKEALERVEHEAQKHQKLKRQVRLPFTPYPAIYTYPSWMPLSYLWGI